MEAIWRRIEAWFRRHAPDALSEFWPGVSAERIAEAESAMGLRFPEPLRESYRIHDGSGSLRMFPDGRLMELIEPGNGVVYEWSEWRELLLEGRLPEVLDPPQDPIKPVPWKLKWVPVTEVGGGGHYCVDLDPAPGGRVGQVIYFYTAIGPIRVVAPGFAEWLEQYATRLESGVYTLGFDLEMEGPSEPL